MFDFDMPPLDWRECRIPKKHKPKEFRQLTIPNDELKAVQRRILRYLYTVKALRPSGFAHGFVPFRNTSTCLDRHPRDADILIGADVDGFFDNFPVECTRRNMLSGGVSHELTDKILTACTYKGCFPQGGPCSPWLTNIGMIDADRMIASYAKKHGFTYSRYADDMAFSLRFADSKAKQHKSYDFLLQGVGLILETNMGLKLKEEKSHIIRMHGSTKPQMLGIVIRQDGLGYNAPRRMRRNIRAAAFNLKRDLDAAGGRPTGEMFARWKKIVGYVRYFDNIRAHGDGDAATADPCVEETIWASLSDTFERKR